MYNKNNYAVICKLQPGDVIRVTKPEFFCIPGFGENTGRKHTWQEHFAMKAHYYRVLDIPSNNCVFHAVNAYGKRYTFPCHNAEIIERVR